MEEMRYLLNDLLKNKRDRALTETIDLLKIAGEIYARDFVELCSILDSETYEENKTAMEQIQNELHLIYKKLAKIKNEMMIY